MTSTAPPFGRQNRVSRLVPSALPGPNPAMVMKLYICDCALAAPGHHRDGRCQLESFVKFHKGPPFDGHKDAAY